MSRAQHWTPDQIGDLRGRTVLVTGANSGIGLETVLVLARHNARVILTSRDHSRLDAATARIRAIRPNAKLTTMMMDLGDLASVRAAVERLAETETIHILINNAGVMNLPERITTKDGLEATVATNHLGHFALTLGLLPALRRAGRARVVTVSAIAARWRSGALDDLMSEKRYRPMGAYAKSKRANVVFTQELARRLAGTGIEAVVVHPGAAMTNLQRSTQSRGQRLFTRFAARALMGSPEAAAWPTLYAATSADVCSGQFIGPAGRRQDSGTPKPVRLPRGADDPKEGRRLWEASLRLTATEDPFARA